MGGGQETRTGFSVCPRAQRRSLPSRSTARQSSLSSAARAARSCSCIPASASIADAPVLDALARGGRVIAPSHPGFGASQLPKGMSTVDDLSYFYLDLLEQLDLDDVLVVGVGLGGWIAAEIAVKDSVAAVAARDGERRRRQDRRPRDPRHRRHLVADARRVQRARLFRSEGRRARLQDPARAGIARPRRATAKRMRGSPGRPTCTIRSSRTGCTASSCRRCSCGAPPTAS